MPEAAHPPHLAYRVHPGNGPFMVLLHGFVSSSAQWQDNLDALGAVCTPITLELWGHGDSPSPEEEHLYHPDAYVAEVEHLRRALGIDTWFVCGYSLGAGIMARYAHRYPQHTLGLVMTNSASAAADAAQIQAWRRDGEISVPKIINGGSKAVHRLPLHPRFAKRIPKPVYDAMVAQAERLDPYAVAMSIKHTSPNASIRDIAPDNTIPSLLCFGRHEKRFEPGKEWLSANMANLEVVELDAGHAVNMEDAAGFNKAVCEFVKAHSKPRHIVDVLIEERAIELRKHPRLWGLVQRFMYPLLGYHQAIELIDRVQPMSGFDTFSHLGQMLQMDISVQGLEHIPREGRVVIMPNHPAGIADGIAVFEAIKAVRPDVAFFANRDAVRCHQRLDEIIIPVEWMEDKRTHGKSKEMVRNMLRAFKDERAIVIFPSGRLARPTPIGLIEREWLASGVSLAQKYSCPIVPMHIRGHNSALYYLLWFLNTELKDMTLFRELLNKTHHRYQIQIGTPVEDSRDPAILTPALRQFVVKDLKRGQIKFES